MRASCLSHSGWSVVGKGGIEDAEYRHVIAGAGVVFLKKVSFVVGEAEFVRRSMWG